MRKRGILGGKKIYPQGKPILARSFAFAQDDMVAHKKSPVRRRGFNIKYS